MTRREFVGKVSALLGTIPLLSLNFKKPEKQKVGIAKTQAVGPTLEQIQARNQKYWAEEVRRDWRCLDCRAEFQTNGEEKITIVKDAFTHVLGSKEVKFASVKGSRCPKCDGACLQQLGADLI